MVEYFFQLPLIVSGRGDRRLFVCLRLADFWSCAALCCRGRMRLDAVLTHLLIYDHLMKP